MLRRRVRSSLLGIVVMLVMCACGGNRQEQAAASVDTSGAGESAVSEVVNEEKETDGGEKSDSSDSQTEKTDNTAIIPQKEKAESLIFEDSGIYISSSLGDTVYVQFAVIIRNPNKSIIAQYPKVRVTVEDGSGGIIATQDQTGMYIMPEDSVVLTGQISLPRASVTADAKIRYSGGSYTIASVESSKIPRSDDFEITGINETKMQYETRVTGSIKNSFGKEIGTVAITALFKKDGKIVAMQTDYLRGLGAGATIPFQISGHGDLPEHDIVEVYAQTWDLVF